MTNTLCDPVDLAGFPGAPFTDTIVDAAVADLRARLGWHVTPVVTETLTLDHDGGRDVILPTRKIVTVTAVRDVSGDTPVALTGWRVAQAGYLTSSWWPRGASVLEVDLQHGHLNPPPDLLAAVAALCGQHAADARLKSVSIDDFQGSFYSDVTATGVAATVMATYGLPRDF